MMQTRSRTVHRDQRSFTQFLLWSGMGALFFDSPVYPQVDRALRSADPGAKPGAENRTAPASPTAASEEGTRILDDRLPEIIPPVLENERRFIPLPEPVEDLAVGGGGRFLALYFKTLQKVGIFDVNELGITRFIPAEGDNTTIAAGATKLIVIRGDRGLISRWNLLTGEKELTQSIDLSGGLAPCAMGSASDRPAVIRLVRRADRDYGGGISLLDIQNLRLVPIELQEADRRAVQSARYFRLSPDGRILGLWPQLHVLVNTNRGWLGHHHSTHMGYIVPAPDRDLVFTGKGIFKLPLCRHEGSITSFALPAVHGPYYLTIKETSGSGLLPHYRNTKTEEVLLHILGDQRPVSRVPNLIQILDQSDPSSGQKLTLEKRMLLIPKAELILQLTLPKDKLVAVKLDLNAVLKQSSNDYLVVTSLAPFQVTAGEELRYQIEVMSSAGGVRFALDSGPEGMQLSPTGLLTWTTTEQSPANADVVVSITDESQQLAFHAFGISVQGTEASGVPVTDGDRAADAPSILDPLPTTPPELGEDPISIELPGDVHDAVLGGCGRFLLLHLKELNRIAVVDLSQAKIVHSVSATDAGTQIAAGATRFLLLGTDQDVISRYRFDTFERERTVRFPFADPTQFLGMGAGSDGPLLVRTCRAIDQNDHCVFTLIDINSLKQLDAKWQGQQTGSRFYSDRHLIHASLDGRLFAVARMGVLRVRVRGDKVDIGRVPASTDRYLQDARLVSADGGYVVSAGRIYDSAGQRLPDDQGGFSKVVPAVTGPCFLKFESQAETITSSTMHELQEAKLFVFGENRPLATIPKLVASGTITYSDAGYPLGLEKRVFFIPDAKLIAVLDRKSQLLRLHRFDIDEALASTQVDYLFVHSHPPGQARLGETYTYSLSVKSKRGGVQYQLEAGPPGMRLSEDGTVTWQVPDQIQSATQEVIVSIRDASEQSIRHRFLISLPEVEQRIAEIRREQIRRTVEDAKRRAEQQRRQLAAQMMKTRLANELESNSDGFKAKLRTWTSSSGDHRVAARFIEIVDQATVVLQLENGEKRSVELRRLANQDIVIAVQLEQLRQIMLTKDDPSLSSPEPPER